MHNKDDWNKIAINNNGSPLHSWEWGRAKELSGNEVAWFYVDENDLKIAVPIIIKKLGILRFGWLPDGMPFSGDALKMNQRLTVFLRKNRMLFMATRFMDFMCDGEKISSMLAKLWLRTNICTYILMLGNKSEEMILQKFNVTTRKHIRRAEREGFIACDLKKEEYIAFWSSYEKFAAAKGFNLPFNKNFFISLVSLVKNDDSRTGLKFIAKKTVKEGHAHDFMLALRFGERAVELLRCNAGNNHNGDYGSKFLSWAIIGQAKRDGVKCYDFGGLNLKNQHGVMQFKKGFGGEISYDSGLMWKGVI